MGCSWCQGGPDTILQSLSTAGANRTLPWKCICQNCVISVKLYCISNTLIFSGLAQLAANRGALLSIKNRLHLESRQVMLIRYLSQCKEWGWDCRITMNILWTFCILWYSSVHVPSIKFAEIRSTGDACASGSQFWQDWKLPKTNTLLGLEYKLAALPEILKFICAPKNTKQGKVCVRLGTTLVDFYYASLISAWWFI